MSLNKKKLKLIKKEFRKSNNYKNYKRLFGHKKMLFILSKISIIFKSQMSVEELAKLEQDLLTKIVDIENWKIIFNDCSKSYVEPFNNCDWESFGNFMFYIWNQWKYHVKKNRKTSLYTINNFNEINELKTKEYNKWMNSMFETKNKNFNIYVRKVIKLL